MSQRDYYDVLGVRRGADEGEIRKAYKKLARQYHPDANPDDKQAAQKFAEITEAYEVLGDQEKRQKYDQFGHAFQGGGGNPFEGFQGAGGGVDLGDLFGGMFGGGGGNPFGGGFGGGGRARPRKGQDIQTEITVPFQVGAEGGTHDLTVQTGGRAERITVKIPAGVDDGAVIRLAGQGNPGSHGGPAGDLRVTVRLAKHPWFRREGRNLILEVPVWPWEAALGARVDVPTLSEGTVVVTIPAGAGSGAKLRLRGKGIRDRRTGERGDQLVLVRIVVPKQLTETERRLFEQLSDENSSDPRAELWKV